MSRGEYLLDEQKPLKARSLVQVDPNVTMQKESEAVHKWLLLLTAMLCQVVLGAKFGNSNYDEQCAGSSILTVRWHSLLATHSSRST